MAKKLAESMKKTTIKSSTLGDVDSQKGFAGINKDIVHINEEKDSKKDGDVGMGIAISG